MQFKINKNLPMSIKDQLKRQIQGMINTQLLHPGQPLPSCNDMAEILAINRNTVATAYAELAKAGVLTSNRGAGTIVSSDARSLPSMDLNMIMDKAFSEAKRMGFSSEEITEQFFNSLAAHDSTTPKTVLMVWCNHLTSKEVGETIGSKLGVRVKRLLVHEITNNPERAQKILEDVDLVVTSLNYIEAILPFAEKQGVEVAGIILTPVSRVLNDIVKMPKGTRVGFVCVNALAAESTCKSIHLSGLVTLDTIWAGADDTTHLRKMISQCDVIFATHHIYNQVVELSGPNKEIINIDVSITESNIQLIRERLAAQNK